MWEVLKHGKFDESSKYCERTVPSGQLGHSQQLNFILPQKSVQKCFIRRTEANDWMGRHHATRRVHYKRSSCKEIISPDAEPPGIVFTSESVADKRRRAVHEILKMGIQGRIDTTRPHVACSPNEKTTLQQVVDVKSPLGKQFYRDRPLVHLSSSLP